MKNNVSNILTNYIIKNGNITEDQRDVYEYGFRSGFAMLCNTISFFIICNMFNMLREGIIFGLLFMILRSYAGGVHLANSVICFFASCAVLIVILMLVQYTQLGSIPILLITFVASLVIWFLAPIENHNKPLDEFEQKMYRKRTRIALIVDILFVFIFIISNRIRIAYIVALIILLMAIIMILGVISNKKYKKIM